MEKARSPQEVTQEEKINVKRIAMSLDRLMDQHKVPTDYRIDVYASLLVGTLVAQREEDEARETGVAAGLLAQPMEPLFPLNIQMLIDTFTGMRDAINAKETGEFLKERNRQHDAKELH